MSLEDSISDKIEEILNQRVSEEAHSVLITEYNLISNKQNIEREKKYSQSFLRISSCDCGSWEVSKSAIQKPEHQERWFK